MSFKKPRPIASVDVKLIENVKVKVNSDLVVKDHYASIMRNKEKWTDYLDIYKKSISEPVKEKDKNNDKTPNTPKYYMKDVELIGNGIIATPEAPDFDTFPARLDNTGGKGKIPRYQSRDPGTMPWIDDVKWFTYTKDGPRKGKTDTVYFAWHRSGNTKGGQSSTGTSTKDCNVWREIQLSGKNKTTKIGAFSEEDEGIFVAPYKTGTRPYATIQSKFKLETNQPFCFHFFKISKELDAEDEQRIKSEAEKFKNLKGKELERAVAAHVVIYWDLCKLTYFFDGRVSFEYDGKRVGKEFKLPTNDIFNMICVYPLGSYLYVYPGTPTTEDTLKNQFAAFNIGKPINFKPSPITLSFACTFLTFNFSPVVHPNEGIIITPPYGAGFQPEKKIVQTVHLGKVGVGTRPSPIVLPDKGDKNQIYGYLRKYPITYSVDEVDSGVFVTTIRLRIPNSAQQLQVANNEFQDMLNQIKEDWNGLFAQAASGAMSWSNAHTQANNVVEERFQDVINNFEETFSEMFENWYVDGDPTTYVDGAQVDLFEDANTIFGGGGGGNASNALDRISNNWKADFLEGLVREAGENIYSPAIFSSQTILKAGLQNVNLAPNPQIENSDVINVTVNQAVEQNKASIVLNNRYNCDESGPGHGRYTYIPGKSNFTGIKPIQIKMGYKGEKSQGEMDTVFTGYVTNRSYSRSAPASSTCILQCEDMSKKLKEQFSVNLPFYDGWCHLAVIYHLAKQAGLDDDEILIYQDPRKASSKQRIRDLLKGDPETFTGGCFDGHVSEDPPGGAGLPGAYLHMCLPLAALGVEEPNYNFSFGTPIWTCMQRIREFSQFYLYANNFGNIIYGPPKTTVQNTGFEFKEVDVNRDYNEFQRQLQVSYDTADTRNAVFLQGISFLPNKNLPGGGSWGTHVHVQKKKNFPNDIAEASYCPWLRYAFLRNPKWEYPNLAAFAAAEIFRRSTRNKFVADYGAWGQPGLFPYDIILLDESQLNETGVNQKECIIAAHTITADTDKLQLNSNFSVELLDSKNINYDPNLPCAVRD